MEKSRREKGVHTVYLAGGLATCLAIGVWGADCLHVYSVLKERRKWDATFNESDKDQNKLLQSILNQYKEGQEEPQDTVSRERFEESLLAEEERRLERWDPKSELDLCYLVQRESIVFLGGGRAALMQLAHPYVAAGIKAHSNLKHGVQERFYRTFKYMFAMIFGDVEESIKASRQVRKLHDKVTGRLGEDVGIFTRDSTYTANHPHALLWVHFTLIDSSVLMFELTKRRLTAREKEDYIKVLNLFALGMFGIPESLLPKSWNDFVKLNTAITQSQVITPSTTSQEIATFLWKPPSPHFRPLMNSIEWLTFVLLPLKLAKPYYGRERTRFDTFFAVLLLGLVRFVYRLLPTSFRYLTAYLKFEQRLGVQRSRLERFIASQSASLASFFLMLVMPPRSSLSD